MDAARMFIGRRSELAMLADHARRAVAGDGRVVVVSGGPGVGKTALARHAFQPFRHQAELHHVSAPSSGAPFSPRREIVRLLTDADPEPRRDDEGRDVSRPSWLEAAALLATLHARASQQPLLLVLDDVELAQGADLQVVLGLAPHLTDLPLLLVCLVQTTGRSRSVGPAPDDRLVDELRLGGLSIDEVDVLVELLRPGARSRSLSTAVFEATGGNPGLVHDLLRALAGNVPAADMPGVPPWRLLRPWTGERTSVGTVGPEPERQHRSRRLTDPVSAGQVR